MFAVRDGCSFVKILHHAKDGGPESCVDGYWLIEVKRLFSIAVLRFGDGSRDSYHNPAFDSVSWVLRGKLREEHLDMSVSEYQASILPVVTLRSTFHRVVSIGTSWVLTFRGPWSKTWEEFNPITAQHTTLASGRKVVQPLRSVGVST